MTLHMRKHLGGSKPLDRCIVGILFVVRHRNSLLGCALICWRFLRVDWVAA
jgi:hypothetical protein